MEVLNAVTAGVPPLGVWRSTSHAEIKNGNKIKAFFKKSSAQSPPSFSNYAENLFRAIGSQLKSRPVEAPHTILLSSLFGAAPAVSALTYEEALQQGVSSSPTEAPIEDIDLNGIIDTVQSFSSENALAIIGGVVLVGVPLVLTRILSTPKTWGTTSAAEAYSKLGEDPEAQLLDIRTLEDIKEVGSPDIRKLKKKAVQITYENDASFLERVSAKFKDPANTILYILDKFDGSSAKVAKLVAENGFKSAFAIKDGVEGPRGWQNSGLPWLLPKKAFKVDLGSLTEALGSVIEDSSGLVPVTVGVAAATGVGLAALSEIETVLQLLGSAALIQIFLKKLLFAEDRKVTLQQLQEFLDTKVAPKELVDELKEIGKAFLPKTQYEATDNGVAVPDSTPVTAVPDSTPVTASSSPEVGGNSVPQPAPVESLETASSVASNSTPKLRPLSPFPHYPDFKPPSSPIPSRP
ncbi:hypothetical protein SUGI_0339010 [Cryptomeria japonica]|uniref:rhodanese-like domain-containing protein 4, chloroplastic n=1 Tax=Cryptomeria japonica TaxID=3369 RepID=UPI002408A398|nr:rhodanese-like domain-containing protein 4, chloroplastic [Cryptomeria japonica]GLJ18955.1 hypothetical protein SUGI_0339010 [Cryptomeria japonica]